MDYYFPCYPASDKDTAPSMPYFVAEAWKRCLDTNSIASTILIDLSKAYDCIPHDLLIAKLEAYGFENNALKLVYSYVLN